MYFVAVQVEKITVDIKKEAMHIRLIVLINL